MLVVRNNFIEDEGGFLNTEILWYKYYEELLNEMEYKKEIGIGRIDYKKLNERKEILNKIEKLKIGERYYHPFLFKPYNCIERVPAKWVR